MKNIFTLCLLSLILISANVSIGAQSTYEFTIITASSIDDILLEQFGADTTCTVFYTYTEQSNETTSCWSQGLQEQYSMFLENMQLPSNYRMRIIYPTNNGLHIKYRLHDGSEYYCFVRRMYMPMHSTIDEIRF